ncbi:DivIVA domain-containing protein [Erysipelothrix sp. HDW6A]|uniref:DivIVA domain-containing protein n=1 Tax=Erysipelothrix sp. HDW6A TaxID=2714928 RepID=UPI00140E1A7E|nr:DivIVA domain-containing protein [Erysipelothrix sp. HDW6A]QIK57571.1 DivIVA domain-containing protein [Erysipelothrix sp. HDW6A]
MAQKLTIDEIMEKEFHVDFKGYEALEVDQFLDEVIQDYNYFTELIKEQQELLKRYEDSLAQQKRVILELEGKSRNQSNQVPSQFSHVDILKRISRLEEVVFKDNK